MFGSTMQHSRKHTMQHQKQSKAGPQSPIILTSNVEENSRCHLVITYCISVHRPDPSILEATLDVFHSDCFLPAGDKCLEKLLFHQFMTTVGPHKQMNSLIPLCFKVGKGHIIQWLQQVGCV